MGLLFKIFLVVHIAGGTLGLLAGTYVMIAKKGDQMAVKALTEMNIPLQ